MLSSQKVFYLVLISIMLLCSVFGISVQGTNTYFPVDPIDIAIKPDDSEIIVGQLSEIPEDDVGFDSTSMGVDVSAGNSTTTEEGYTHNDNVSYITTTTTTTASTTVPTSNVINNGDNNGNGGNGGNGGNDNNGHAVNGTTTTTTRRSNNTTTTTTVNTPNTQNRPTSTTTRVNTPGTTTTTTTRRSTTTTTRTTTVRTTTTTTFRTTRPTTTSPRNYSNSGNISFALTSGGSTVTEYNMYAGTSVRLYLKSGFADTPIAIYNSDYPHIANTTGNEVGSVLVSAYSPGTTWIHASNINGTCHIKITVDDFESRVIYLCNQERAAYGLPPLQPGGSDLKRVADLRLSEAYTQFSHTRPNGTRYITAYGYYGLSYLYAGENLARGQTSPEQVVREWMASPTHRANILNPNFRYCCVSTGTTKHNGLTYTYWSQQFYTPQY